MLIEPSDLAGETEMRTDATREERLLEVERKHRRLASGTVHPSNLSCTVTWSMAAACLRRRDTLIPVGRSGLLGVRDGKGRRAISSARGKLGSQGARRG